MTDKFTPQQKNLLEEIWRISEEGWHAGWMADIEFDLWKIVQTGSGMCGQLKIDSATIGNLKSLSEQAKGWFYWDEEEEEKWIDIEAWKEMYREKQDKPS